MQTLPPRQAHPARSHTLTARTLALLALVSAFLLSACGADVNTQLTLHDDYSGQRQFVLTMADSDAETLDGGVDAAEQALEAHTPDVLEFDGLESESEGFSASFTLDFDDAEDYQNKITALLDASNVPASDRGMKVDIQDEALVSSIVFEEDFYNDDLMGWAGDALIEQEVVPGNTPIFTSNGSASVVFDGEEVETSTSLPRINFSLTDDRRFEDIGMDFEILESGNFHIAMSYLVSPDDTATQNAFIDQRVEQLHDLDGIDGTVEDSGAVENHDSGNPEPREISATFSSADAVERGMQVLLANDQATFEVTDVADESTPDVITEYVGTNWNCETICNPDLGQQLDGDTTVPEHWQLVDQRRGNGEFYVEANRGMPLASLTSTTSMDFNGSMEQRFEFTVDNETLEGHEDSVAQLFEPADGSGTFETTTQGSTTRYTVALEAQDAESLEANLNRYFADKGVEESVTINHAPLTGIWANYDLEIDLSAIWELASGGVEETATFQVELPPMHSGSGDNATASNGTVSFHESTGTFNVNAHGPTITTVWIAIILVVILVLAIATVVLWRRRVSIQHASPAMQDSASAKPYNVQGPHDVLTETEIYHSPLAPGTLGTPDQEASAVPGNIDPEHTRIYDQTRPFPDVPIPSVTDYQEFQGRVEKEQDATQDVEPDSESKPGRQQDQTSASDHDPEDDAQK